MLHSLFALFFVYVETSHANRCCQFHCDRSACLGAQSDDCQWLEEGTDDALIIDGVQCRSSGWGECGSCCPQCPGVPSDFPTTCGVAEEPCAATTSSTTTTTTTTSTTSTTPSSTTSTSTSTTHTSATSTTSASTTSTSTAGPSTAGLPGKVAERIAADEGDCGKINSQNCWTDPGSGNAADENYSPNTVSFTGVDVDGDACCYKYTSVYGDTPNCAGKTPEQSHLTFEMDCPVGDFEVVANSDSIAYGLDGSTCYWGVKIDTGCGGTCHYSMCITYANLAAGVCPVIEGWVMDKASNVFSFNSLYGIPSCDAAAAVEAAFDVGMITGVTTYVHQYTSVQLTMMIMIVAVLCAVWLYRKRDTNGEYKRINDVASDRYNYESTV